MPTGGGEEKESWWQGGEERWHVVGGDDGRGVGGPFFYDVAFAVDLVLFGGIFLLVDSHDAKHMRNITFSSSCQ
jgi:hypothetical protein